jgi:uncharacterized protein
MSTNCEAVARYVLPLFRAFVAKELIEKYGCTQVQAAKKLGTTQAAISQYMTSKRGSKGGTDSAAMVMDVQEAASKMAKKMATGDVSREEFSAHFCELCTALRSAKKILV